MTGSKWLTQFGAAHSTRPLIVLLLTLFVVAGHAEAQEGPTEIHVYRAHTLPLPARYPFSISILPETSRLAIATPDKGLLLYDTEVAEDQRVTTSVLTGVSLGVTRSAALKFASTFKTSKDAQGRGRTTVAPATLDPLAGYLNWRKSTKSQQDILDINLPLQLALERAPGNDYGTIQVRSLGDLGSVESIRLSDRSIRMVRLSPDGSLFLSSLSAPDYAPPSGRYGVETQLRVFPTGEVVAELPPFGNPVSDACFSRDGRLLLLATGAGYDFTGIGGGIVEGPDRRVFVFSVPDGKPVFEWTGFEKPILFATFNADESLILAGSGNWLSILDWKGKRERVRLVAPANEKEFISADITADGTTVYTLQKDGLLRSWALGDLLK